jgi:hypothetical protein
VEAALSQLSFILTFRGPFFLRAFYQGITLEYMYNHVYDVIFGTASNFKTVAIKVTFDMFVQATLITLPVAYLAKAAIYRYGTLHLALNSDVSNSTFW